MSDPYASLPLPEGWRSGVNVDPRTRKDRVYYYNVNTGTRQWEHPSAPPPTKKTKPKSAAKSNSKKDKDDNDGEADEKEKKDKKDKKNTAKTAQSAQPAQPSGPKVCIFNLGACLLSRQRRLVLRD